MSMSLKQLRPDGPIFYFWHHKQWGCFDHFLLCYQWFWHWGNFSDNIPSNKCHFIVDSEVSSMLGSRSKMWARDLPGIYEALNKEWSETVKHILQAIHGRCYAKTWSIWLLNSFSVTPVGKSVWINVVTVILCTGVTCKTWRSKSGMHVLKIIIVTRKSP